MLLCVKKGKEEEKRVIPPTTLDNHTIYKIGPQEVKSMDGPHSNTVSHLSN